MTKLIITSPSFEDEGLIPRKHTGFGRDISPAFHLEKPVENAVSMAIIMDDLNIPFISEYNHWVIWNLPVMTDIPEDIPYGENIGGFENATQGIGYGRNRYRGPKQPFFVKGEHRYRFTFYILDCVLTLDCTKGKEDLLKEMEGHVLQSGCITGRYKR